MLKQINSCSTIERSRVAEYVQKWGNSSSVSYFDPECQFFCVANLEGIIGYRSTKYCAVVVGDPVCPPENVARLTQAFHDFCKENNLKIVYITASASFAQWTLDNKLCASAIGIGNEVTLDPQDDPKTHRGHDGSSLRNKVSYSIRRGLSVKEYLGNDPDVEKRMEDVAKAWLEHRKGPQIYFAHIDLFEDRANKRWFYAEYQQRIVGILLLNKLEQYHGFAIYYLLLAPGAPTTTSEFIVLSVLDVLRQEGCRLLSAGVIIDTQLGPTHGLSWLAKFIAHHAFSVSRKIFKLNHRQQYWKKFAPQKKPSYVLFSQAGIRLRDILSIMRAMNAKI